MAERGTRDPRAFPDRLMELSNGGLLALMVSVGHRTGLFDVMATMPAATSAEIAQNAGLDERYVREWLGAMTTGLLIVHDPRAMTFSLPADHAACLARSAGPANSAAGFQLLGMFAAVEDQVVKCFRRGGGIPWSEFPRFEEIKAEVGWAALDAGLLDQALSLIPGLNERLHAGIDVADIGCGYGHAVNIMAETFPSSRFVGWDLFAAGLEAGRAEASRKQLTNVIFEERDAATLGERERFDFITTLSTVYDQARPDRILRGIATALRPDGRYLCADIGGGWSGRELAR